MAWNKFPYRSIFWSKTWPKRARFKWALYQLGKPTLKGLNYNNAVNATLEHTTCYNDKTKFTTGKHLRRWKWTKNSRMRKLCTHFSTHLIYCLEGIRGNCKRSYPHHRIEQRHLRLQLTELSVEQQRVKTIVEQIKINFYKWIILAEILT